MKKQILIIKHGALGDIVQAFDSFYSIRVNFKDHKITLLTSYKFKKFMKLTNWFDNVIIDNRSGFWNFKEIYRIFKVLKGYSRVLPKSPTPGTEAPRPELFKRPCIWSDR